MSRNKTTFIFLNMSAFLPIFSVVIIILNDSKYLIILYESEVFCINLVKIFFNTFASQLLVFEEK